MVGRTLKPDELLALPIDELALRVLFDAEATSAWNRRNWMQAGGQRYGRQPR